MWLASWLLAVVVSAASDPAAPAGGHVHAMAAPPDSSAAAHDPDSGAEWIGQALPEWALTRWVRGPSRTLASLRGRVVLVRFWTEDCRFCRATLPAIERLRAEDEARGLTVIGVFHPPHPGERRSDRQILAIARQLGFHGPIGLDQDWHTLDRWWLDGHPDRNWVSVSFLIGRDGRVRWIHGGGEYHPTDDPKHARCNIQYDDFVKKLDALLAERPQVP
jgi:thiol-disulfide isomerase/thioredoxin